MFEKAIFIFNVAVQIPEALIQNELGIDFWLKHEFMPALWRFERKANHLPPYAGIDWTYPVEELLQKHFGKTADAFPPINIILRFITVEQVTLHSLRSGDAPPQWVYAAFAELETLGIKAVAFGKAIRTMGS